MTDDLWTQLREARKRDPHEEKIKTQALRRLRNEEIEAELPHPQCCADAKKYIFAYRLINMQSEEVLNGGVPVWKNTFNTVWRGGDFYRVSVQIHFCPFCGAKLPALRKKAKPPPFICQDGDFRCKGCGERFGSGYCWCSLAESAFEPVP